MEDRFARSVICPTLIGREDDLAVLQRFVEEAKHGDGQVAFVSGEAGVGKSRLMAETAHFSDQQGFLHLQGHCFQTDSVLPYAPFLDLLHFYMLSVTPEQIAQEWEPIASELLGLMPELRKLIPSFASVSPLPALDPQQEKRRLFAAITHFLTQLATRQPLLLIVEDLHWCDEISLECLFQLARHTVHLPLFLLLSYRNDEVSVRLRHWLAAFDREHLSHEVVLVRLSRDEVDAMLQAIFALHASMHTGLSESIYALTDGNPFFIEEVLKSLIVSGEIASRNGVWERTLLLGAHKQRPLIPRSVQDTVQQRSEQLTPLAQQLLTLAAVAGRRFDFSLLQSILQLDEEQMLLLVKELLEAQFVVEESEERFSFRHALTRQAIYSRQLIRERKALHRTLGETIELLHPAAFAQEALLVDLAYHFFEGEVWSKAFEYGQRAAERSVALFAPRAAIEHFTRALTAQSHLQEIPSAELHRARGQAYETLGEFERARSDYEQALAIARQTRNGVMEWQSLLDIGFLWAGRDYEQAGQWLRQALDLAQHLADRRLQAQSLNRLGNWLVNTGQAERGLEAHQEALAMFERLQDTPGIAETQDLLAMASGIYGDTVSAVEHIQRAIELFRAQHDKQHLISSLVSYIAYAGPSWVETTYSVSDSLENCMRVADEALHLAQQADSLHEQAYIEWMTGGTLACYGEFGAARQHAQESLRIATEIGHAQWTAGAYFTLGRLYILMLEPSLAMETLKKGLTISSKIGSAWWTGNLTAYFVQACILKGALPRAEAALKAVMARDQAPRNSPERRMIWAWGELALANDEPGVALDIAERLLASAPGAHQEGPIPWLLYLKARALIATGRLKEAPEVLEAAKSGLLARQERPLLWQAHALLGQVHTYLKQEKLARQEFIAASHVIHALKATIDDAYLREHFSRMALKTLPRELSLSGPDSSVERFHGLTEREYTVATLVTGGKSNREIAETLIVGERTVETHVSNILSKLDFTSRKQIATWRLQYEEQV
ncbi:MAG: AAA family ATPase [Ktedonobacteraceae bacterium]|nr:AAA family ATPase [Ktedonobacteraceae bacterium]